MGGPRGRRRTGLLVAAVALFAAPAAVAAPPEPAGALSDGAGAGRSYTETRMPAGPPVGVVLVVHGTGWQGVAPSGVRYLAAYRDLLPSLRRAGLITVNATHRAGEPGWADVLALHRQLRGKWPTLPVSALGQSSGGTWSLLLGAARPLVAVVAEGAPTDFATWRTAYPCFHADCRPVAGTRTSLGEHWYHDRLSRLFGADTDPSPNLLDYAPVPHLRGAAAPPVLVVSGARQAADGSPLADGTPAWVDGLEADPLITQQQAHALAAAVGDRARLRLLGRGSSPWVHGVVDEAQLAAAYAEIPSFLADRSRAATVVPAVARGVARPAAAVGTATIVSCDAAPIGAGLLAVAGWDQAVARGMDASDNGCAAIPDRVGPDVVPAHGPLVGTSLHPDPQDGRVATGAAATATFRAPPGTSVAGLRAAYAGRATADGWRSTLHADDHEVLACSAPCRALDSGDSAAGWPARDVAVPAGTTRLVWSLACVAPSGCPAAADGEPAAWLNVFAAEVALADADPPSLAADAALLAGDGAGRVRADDALGVQRVEVRVDGRLVTTLGETCDFARPRPCPALEREVRIDRGALTAGDHDLTLTAVDAAARERTVRGVVRGAAAPGGGGTGGGGTTVPDGSGSTTVPDGSGGAALPTPGADGGALALPLGGTGAAAADPFLTAAPDDLLRACARRPLLVRDVRPTAAGVVVRGLGSPALAGRTVTFLLDGRPVATATLSRRGRVSARLPHGARVALRLGTVSSATVALRPRLTLAVRRRDGLLHLTGRTPGARVTLRRRVSCTRSVPLATARATAGRFAVAVAAPPGRATLVRATVGRASVTAAG